MSLRNFVSSYPQLSVNAPPPQHHQTHRVQALPVSVATALQQQMSQQPTQGTQQNNQNNSPNVNAQQAPSHEYHVAHLPFQTTAGASIAPNFIRHMSNGAYQTHPQNPYQAQGPQPQQQSSNPTQSIQNTAPSSQPRLTPMAPPTAPPTPPTQQQPSQGQQTQYAVAQGGASQPQRSAASYPRAATSNVRRPQQPQPQQYIYSQPLPPYNFVIPNHIRQAVPISAQPYPQVFAQQLQQFTYYPPAQSYQQMAGPTSNGGQRQQPTTSSSGPPSMPTSNEYPSYVYDTNVMPVMQQQQQPAVPPPQKTAKKSGSKALTIINPATGKSIFEDDSSTISNDKEKVDHKEETEKENSEPLTPVVSAMSDGPSVDITPKHTVKIKKTKPPEAIPLLADPPKKIEPTVETVDIVSQDCENNNRSVMPEILTEPFSSSTPPPASEQPMVVVQQSPQTPIPDPVRGTDSNDTNNNSYKKVTADENQNEKNNLEEQPVSDEIEGLEVIEVPQDTNNNSTEDEVKQPIAEGAIDYDDDQWSPANTAGKKYYTRDQLLKLKDIIPVPHLKLPEGVANTLMKNNKECLTNTLNQTMPPMGMRQPFDAINSVAPKFMNNQLSGRNPYPNKRPSQQGMKQQVPGRGGSQSGSDRQIIKLHLSLQDNVKLNEAENAWKPSHLQAKPEFSEEERQTFDVLSKFRSMLNKLTAENFDVLVEQCRTFKIDTTERLDGVISLLFEKAISEPKFAPTYATLCKEISNIQSVPSAPQDHPQDKQTKKNTLKVRLITQCQKEFERNKEDTVVFRDIEEKLRENENDPDAEKREELKVALEEEHYKLRQRANGTVKFIGELYKIDMLTSKIMRTCIEMLLSEPTEEKVERVCKLLTTIGSKMEAADGRQSLNKYFHILSDMTALSHKTIRSSRIKFEIQNLEDLRNNNWKARRQDLIPKTMDQMQWEADQEQQMINYQTRQAKDDRHRGGRESFNKRQQPQQDSDGWSVQQNTKSRAQPIQLAKISLPSMSDSSAKLGNASQFQNFMMQTNKFAGLAVEGDGDQQRFGGSGSKNSSMERGDRGSRFYGNGGDRYSGRGSSNQTSRNTSQIRSRDNSGSRGGNGGPSRSLQAPPRSQLPPLSSMSFSGPPAVKKPPSSAVLTEEEVDKMVKELVTVVDAYKEDKLTLEGAIEKAHKVSINKDVLVEIYNKFLDRKDNDRENLMLLFVEMLKQKMIIREDNKLALHKVMMLAPDFQCDVPRIYEYIAQFLSELLIANVLAFQEVYQICQADECDKENVLRFIFSAVEKRHGANSLQHIVVDSDCDLGQFTKDGNFGQWLEVNKFTNMVRRGTRGIADVIEHIKTMLTDKCTSESVMEYISSTECSKDPSFIRQLTIVVMECCCDEYIQSGSSQPTYKLNNVKLEPLSMLLQRYIDNNIERELQCIYALQNFAFVREYPPGFLNSIFDLLYDNDVLSADAFESWKNSDDQTEGKGVAVCSTRQFFTKLAEDEDDDEEDTAGSN